MVAFFIYISSRKRWIRFRFSLSIYTKRTKPIYTGGNIDAGKKRRKRLFLFSPALLLWLMGFCYLCIRSPPLSEFLRFFVTILLPTVSNRWASSLIIRLIYSPIYNMWQNIINSYQLWKKRKKEQKKS